jgi:CubicO group peptidase (beta-lactamase class C family)
VDDLAAFGTMLLDGGRARDGATVLAPTTVEAMTTARIPLGDDGGGWGLGLGVDLADQPDGRHAGAYGWDGGLGTSWWNDPATRTTAILLTNLTWTSPAPPDHFWSFWRAAFRAR